MPGRLNIFQRTMLQWNGLHPYNAVNVVRIPGAMDLELLRNVINTTLQAWGLTCLTINRKSGHFHYHRAAVQCEIKIIAAGENLPVVEIERQINTAFDTGARFNPFRFFAAHGKKSFALGLVYFHSIADDGSVMLLLKEIVDIYLGKNPAGSSAPVELYLACHDRLLRHHPGLLARKLAAIPSLVSDMKNSSRPPCRDSQNMDNGFDFFSMKPETLKSLLKTAKSWGVTLNDLFLAILMKCFSPLADGRRKTAGRRKISIGCIVNARKDIGLHDRRNFGLFLGLFTVSLEVPDEVSVKNLAKEIRRQTREIKRKRLYLGTPLEMAFGRLLFPWLSNARKTKLFRQSFPLWGGITNMNLNSLWDQHDETKPSDYFRAVSTGPAVPFVLSVTTFNDVVNIGVSFRTSIFSAAEIERIKAGFLKMSGQMEAA
ncbi:MAG TPA: condensation domain-containing protein [Verrucomicrobiae bacterium]